MAILSIEGAFLLIDQLPNLSPDDKIVQIEHGNRTIVYITRYIEVEKEIVKYLPAPAEEKAIKPVPKTIVYVEVEKEVIKYLPAPEPSKKKRRKQPQTWNKKLKEQRLAYRAACLAYKGGKCIYCGYDRCPTALEFHHRDSSTKKFAISSQTRFFNSSLSQEVLDELDKCNLVCVRCHREIHAGYKFSVRPVSCSPQSEAAENARARYFGEARYSVEAL